MNNNLNLVKKVKTKNYAPRNVWCGNYQIDDNLQLFYEIFKHGDFWNLVVSSNDKFAGSYWGAEQLHDEKWQAEDELDRFINEVKSNPEEYK